MNRASAVTVLALLAAGSACDQSERTAGDRTAQAGDAAAAPPSIVEINAQPVVAPSGPAQLTPLAAGLAARALGTVAVDCRFVYQGRALLVAGAGAGAAAEAPAKALLVIDGRELSLPGNEAGGRRYLEAGGTFAGEGFTVAVLRAEGTPETINGRNEWAADLVVAGQTPPETRFSPGTWSCSE